MTLEGTVRDGLVVPDGPHGLADGTRVQVVMVGEEGKEPAPAFGPGRIREVLQPRQPPPPPPDLEREESRRPLAVVRLRRDHQAGQGEPGHLLAEGREPGNRGINRLSGDCTWLRAKPKKTSATLVSLGVVELKSFES